MQLLTGLKQNKLFCVLVVAALILASVFAVSVIQKTERQTRFLEIQLRETIPPFEIEYIYATKKEFDTRYELERYWGFDHIEYLQNIFVPRLILIFFGKRLGVEATPTDIMFRKNQELQRAGMTVAQWKEMLKERKISEEEVDTLIREKVIAEKMIDTGTHIELTDDDVQDFYERFLKNNLRGTSFDELSEQMQEEARTAAIRYKKLSLLGNGNRVGDYQKVMFAVQKMYLCRKSS